MRQDQEGGGTWIGGGSKDCIPARWEVRDLHISISSPSLLPFRLCFDSSSFVGLLWSLSNPSLHVPCSSKSSWSSRGDHLQYLHDDFSNYLIHKKFPHFSLIPAFCCSVTKWFIAVWSRRKKHECIFETPHNDMSLTVKRTFFLPLPHPSYKGLKFLSFQKSASTQWFFLLLHLLWS